MKKFRTFFLISLAMLILMFVIQVFEINRNTARGTLQWIFRDFYCEGDTKLTLIFYRDGEVVDKRQIGRTKDALSMYGRILCKYVKSGKIADETVNISDYVQVELDNGKSKCTFDFPGVNPCGESFILTDSESGNQIVYKVSPKGASQIRSMLEE